MNTLTHIALIGMGATATIDLWAIVRKRLLGIALPNYGLVGRWLIYLARGQVRHDSIAATRSVFGEKAIGWIGHYFIGCAFAMNLFAAYGNQWLRYPTPAPAVFVGFCTVAAPLFIMQPGMGAGVAGSRTPNPTSIRIQSLTTHVIFGFALYLSARVISLFI